MQTSAHIAVDLGAESGRVIVGVFDGGSIALEECHRFTHHALPSPAGLCWDITGIWREILEGLRAAAAFTRGEGMEPQSIGVDSWAVDYGLVSMSGELLGLPRCYRDPAFVRSFEQVRALVSSREVYDHTGIQHLPFNTLYQYAERVKREPDVYERGSRLLFMPDLFHWLLCGVASTEHTMASTSQMVDVRTGMWNTRLLAALNLPVQPLMEPLHPGTTLGTLRSDVANATGLPISTKVILPATHDTASAIAAVPAEGGTDWCYLSSGTWSLLGAELTEPCITSASAEANFTNELGVNRTVRFLKNISGLWLVQRLRAEFESAGSACSYAELTERAAGAESFRTLIAVNDARLMGSADLREAIGEHAHRTNQPAPTTVGQFVRCCLESLALEYRRTLETMEHVLARQFATLHIVGGGAKNGLLNRMTADATGCRVVVGPTEATAIGNLLVQAMSSSGSCDLAAVRAVVRDSFELDSIEPSTSKAWKDAIDRYRRIVNDARE